MQVFYVYSFDTITFNIDLNNYDAASLISELDNYYLNGFLNKCNNPRSLTGRALRDTLNEPRDVLAGLGIDLIDFYSHENPSEHLFKNS